MDISERQGKEMNQLEKWCKHLEMFDKVVPPKYGEFLPPDIWVGYGFKENEQCIRIRKSKFVDCYTDDKDVLYRYDCKAGHLVEVKRGEMVELRR